MPAKRAARKLPPEPLPSCSLTACLDQDGALEDCLVKIGKAGRHGFADELKVMSRKQLLELCSSIQGLCTAALQYMQDPPDDENASDEEMLGHMSRNMELVQGSAHLGLSILEETRDQVPETVQQTAVLLHDNCLLAMGCSEELAALQDPVLKLCSRWYELNAPGRDSLVAQSLPMLLARAVNYERAADIKAVYMLRDGFTLFDYLDASIDFTTGLMLRASISPGFLRRPDGRKLISFLYRLHGPLVADLTVSMQQQITSNRRAVLDAYGEILFRAWRDSVGGPFQFDIEADCIQVLMKAAIGAATPALGTAVRQVLGAFHSQKKMGGVDAMLCRLYEPILFRAFGAANADMRRNALLLLLDAFPVRDPDAPADETDESMTRQFKLLQEGLQDVCPLVREVAARGVIKLLNTYWELIPMAVIAVFITKLTNEVAFDMSWPGVRVAVLDTLPELVDNPHAQPVLKKALPVLAPLLTDPVLKVRIAMANLLGAVSRCRALHYWDVVPLEHVLATMAVDAPPVARVLHAILLPSLFPDDDGAVHVANLLKARTQTGLAFCQYLVYSFGKGETDTEAVMADEEGQDAPPPGVSNCVPLERILLCIKGLIGHMLATCTTLVPGPVEESGNGAAAKKQRNSKTRATKAAGKRRQGKAADDNDAAASQGTEQREDGAAGADGGVQVAEQEPETYATWAAWAAGLAILCGGVAAAIEAEQCGTSDVELAVDSGDLFTLLYEASPNDAARCAIMQAAAKLPFLPASNNLRTVLIKELATSTARYHNPASTLDLTQAASKAGKAATLADSGQLPQPCWLDAALHCLCVANSGPKLMAMLLKAFGLRAPATIHVPVGHAGKQHQEHAAHGSDDEEQGELEGRCGACGLAEPEDGLLLCDGCDAMYHMGCVRPEITDVPQGDWFCSVCEQELHNSNITAAGAVRCLEAILSLPPARQVIHDHAYFPCLLPGLQAQTQAHTQWLIRMLRRTPRTTTTTSTAAVDGANVEETAAAPVVAQKGKKGRGKGKNSKAKVAAAVKAEERADEAQAGAGAAEQAENEAQHVQHQLTADELAQIAEAVAVARVYTRAALHLSLLGITPGAGEADDEELSEEQQQERRTQFMEMGASALLEAEDMCEQMLEECVNHASSSSPQLQHGALQLIAPVLGLLGDAESLQMLDSTFGGQLSQVQHVCNMGKRLVEACTQLLNQQRPKAERGPDGRPLSTAGQADALPVGAYTPTIKSALAHMMLLCTHMVTRLSSMRPEQQQTEQETLEPSNQQLTQATDTAAGVAAPDDADAQAATPQHLGHRLEQEASNEPQVSAEALAAVDSLASALLQLLHGPAAAAAGLLSGVTKQQASTLLAALMEPDCKVPHGWLEDALTVAGSALQEDEADQGSALADVSNAQSTAAAGNRHTANKVAARATGVSRKRRSKQGSAVEQVADENALPADEGAGQEEGQHDIGVEGVGDGDKEGMEAGKAANNTAARAQLGTMTTLLLNVSKAKGQEERLLDLATRLACDSWQTPASLAGLAILHHLGIAGLRARRLRLGGHDANLLIKLELLSQEVAAAKQAAEATATATQLAEGVDLAEIDMAAQQQAQQQGEQAGRVFSLLTSLLNG